jgi:quercetin dioxygenase-like cupin family protein
MTDKIWNAREVESLLLKGFEKTGGVFETIDISHLPLNAPRISVIDTPDEKLTVCSFAVKKETRFDMKLACIDLVRMASHQTVTPHIHDHAGSFVTVVKGKGRLNIGPNHFDYAQNDQFIFPAGISHGFRVEDETVISTLLDNPIYVPDAGYLDLRHA